MHPGGGRERTRPERSRRCSPTRSRLISSFERRPQSDGPPSFPAAISVNVVTDWSAESLASQDQRPELKQSQAGPTALAWQAKPTVGHG